MTAESIAYYASRIANSGPSAGPWLILYCEGSLRFPNSINLDMEEQAQISL